MKSAQWKVKFFYAGGRADGRTARQWEAIVAFRNFANGPKNSY